MSERREPSEPPEIPGFSPTRLLGMGGFADVFLYQQLMPRRSVAVKVLLAGDLGRDVRERFRAEADVMAKLSHHPSIVSIYHADVAADGRPYLVMEYCSRQGLGERFRRERMPVGEVLRIGVRLASAVETAHRAGVLHRDIKPANVLVTDFGWPALTDFGIAGTTGLSPTAAIGMSIPWAPPELLAEDPGADARADVYSLAATIYSLLAQRSPFELPGGPNAASDLIARIERSPLPPVGRSDVPPSLQAVLARAMDRAPDLRHQSAVAFARALQQVEAELMLPSTALDLPQDGAGQSGRSVAATGGPLARTGDTANEEDQPTRVRPIPSISPDLPADADRGEGGARMTPAVVDQVTEDAADGVPVDTQDTAQHLLDAWRRHAEAGPVQPSSAGSDGPARDARNSRTAGVVGGVVVLVAVVTAAVLALGGPPPAPEQADPAPTPSGAPLRAVPAPADVVATAGDDGSVVVTWTNPEPVDGDRYLWGVVEAGAATTMEVVEEPTVTVRPAVPGRQVCVEVSIVRTDGRASTRPAVGCTDR